MTVAGSPAVRYRERRVNRAVYGLGLLALLIPWLFWSLQLHAELSVPASMLARSGLTLRSFMHGNLLLFASNPGSPFLLGVFLLASAAIGIGLVENDRMTGALFYTLEGPVRRRDLWGVKVLGGGLAIVSVAAFGTACTLAAAAASDNLGLALPILARGLGDAVYGLSFFASALAMGGAMAAVFSVIAVGTWAFLPTALAGLVTVLFQRQVTRYVVLAGGQRITVRSMTFLSPWLAHLPSVLQGLSPFSGLSAAWSPSAQAVLVVGYAVWTVFMVWLGIFAFDRAPFERLRDGFFFPPLWNVYFAFLALASGLLLTTIVTQGEILGLGWAAIYAAFAVSGFFFWRAAMKRRERRGAWRSAPLL